MEYVTLNNGIKMPKLGYGVYQTPPDDTKNVSWTQLQWDTEVLTQPRPMGMKRGLGTLWPNVA